MFEDNQIGHRADEADLTDFLLETQEKHDSIVFFDIDFTTKIAAQVALICAAEPAQIALTMGCDTVVETVQNGPLLLLHQK
ncbi:hypothetical protein D3C85_1780090 [compost metagenome]